MRKSQAQAPGQEAAPPTVSRRGRPGKWDDDQEQWFSIHFPGYDCKVSPHNGKAEDDDNLKDYVDHLWDEFRAKYAHVLEGTPAELEMWKTVSSFSLSFPPIVSVD